MIYILGAGAVGLPLAAYLASSGADVTLLRIRPGGAGEEAIPIIVHNPAHEDLRITVPCAPLSVLESLDGIVVVAAKSFANEAISSALAQKSKLGPVILMQNGIGTETPYLRNLASPVCRCVLYMSSQTKPGYHVHFRQITSSPIGTVGGGRFDPAECVHALTTPFFQFHAKRGIERDIWKKVIVNCVFNSICPLLDVDNGVFARDVSAAALAVAVVEECVQIAACSETELTAAEVMDQVMAISGGSQGVLISTLQDINNGNETEIETLNLAVAQIASELEPRADVTKTELLGKMTLMKSRLRRGG